MLPDIPHSINVSFDALFDKHIFLLPDGDFLSLIYIKILIHPGLKNCEHILDLFSKKVMRNDNPEGQYGQIVCM